ncbi:MAG: hypothetical protein WBD37_12880 [Anderseniella sp.]
MIETTKQTSPPQAIETIFVGSAMEDVCDAIMAQDGPVHGTHMRSIDDLLSYIEDNYVECAVVDQSLPTESRGLKLVLLAAANKIKHLIVLAPAKQRADIEAIHGVHQVLRTPAAPKQIIGAVFDHAEHVMTHKMARSNAKTEEAKTPVPDIGKAVPAPAPDKPKKVGKDGILNKDFITRVKGLKQKFENSGSKTLWQRFLPLVSYAYKKLAIVILTSLFALFLSYGSIILFFLTSSSWSMPIELSSGHALVVRAEKDLGEMQVRQNQVTQSLEAARSALTIAERDKRDAKLRLEISKRTIDVELGSQSKLLRETREHILRLKQIISDFRNANGRGTFARNLEKAYENRTITKKSLEAGTLAILESLHRMAVVSNELAVKEIEEDRINTRVEFLNSLRAQIDQPEIRTLSAAGSDLVYLAREVIADHNVIAQADKHIASKQAEIANLSDSLGVVTGNINSLLATPVGRAITNPVTVVFVPYENSDNFSTSQPLIRCAMMIAFCSKVGETGELIPGETNAVHPLFGKPLRGQFVEALLKNNNDAKEELLHAGRPPLFF